MAPSALSELNWYVRWNNQAAQDCMMNQEYIFYHASLLGRFPIAGAAQ